jgi:tricorn protease
VRGVDFKYKLVDGTLAAQPKYAYWFADVGWVLENHGVDPDVEVTSHRTTGPQGAIPSSTPPSGWRCAGAGTAPARRSARRLTR